MAESTSPDVNYVPVADVTVDLVRPTAEGFILEGRGSGGADYRMDMHVDLRLDGQTRRVLGELLSQSEWKISRRVRPPLGARRRGKRAAGR